MPNVTMKQTVAIALGTALFVVITYAAADGSSNIADAFGLGDGWEAPHDARNVAGVQNWKNIKNWFRGHLRLLEGL